MERFKELLEKRWREPRGDPRLVYEPRRKVFMRVTRYLMRRFVSSVLVRSTFVQGSLV